MLFDGAKLNNHFETSKYFPNFFHLNAKKSPTTFSVTGDDMFIVWSKANVRTQTFK